MAKLVIVGGRKLEGAITLAGAKNSISKVLIASLLTEEPLHIANVPDHGETAITIELCRKIGALVEHEGDAIRIHTPEITNSRVTALSRKNRIPILALGPLLARVGEAVVPSLGGDNLGVRPVNFHIAVLEKLGATVEVKEGSFHAYTHGLHGARLSLPYPSVGATETAIFASVLAKGNTVIENAAIEPEIIDMLAMLQNMGARIELGAGRTIHIEGVERLHGTEHRIIPDRIEAASFASMAMATRGDIMVREARQEHLLTFLNAIRRIGGQYEVSDDGIRFFWKEPLRAIHIETDTHPGFMTDWQQPFAVVMTQAHGESIIHETVYEDRFAYVENLHMMGAHITIIPKCLGALPCRFQGKMYNHTALVRGPTPLSGEKISMPDIRAGMAYVIAALAAGGTSEISGVAHIDRGYEKIDERIRALGADIRRID